MRGGAILRDGEVIRSFTVHYFFRFLNYLLYCIKLIISITNHLPFKIDNDNFYAFCPTYLVNQCNLNIKFLQFNYNFY